MSPESLDARRHLALPSFPHPSDAAAAGVQFLILARAGAPPGVSAGLSFGKSPDQLKTQVILEGVSVLAVRYRGM